MHLRLLRRRASLACLVLATVVVLGGCGQASRSGPPSVGSGSAVVTSTASGAVRRAAVLSAGKAVPARVVAKVLARQHAADATAARLRHEAALIVSSDDRVSSRRHRLKLSPAAVRTRAAAVVKAVRSPAAVQRCVVRARRRLLSSLGKRFASATQIDSVLKTCISGPVGSSRPKGGL